jgi:hypothetical protein
MKKHELNIPIADIPLIDWDDAPCVAEVNIVRSNGTKDTIYNVVLSFNDDGSLNLECYEESNPHEIIGNTYPEYQQMHSEHTHGLTTTVDGEVI